MRMGRCPAVPGADCHGVAPGGLADPRRAFESKVAGGALLDDLEGQAVALGRGHAGGVRQVGRRVDGLAQAVCELRDLPVRAEALGDAAHGERGPQVRVQGETGVALLACVGLVEVDAVRVPRDGAVPEQLQGCRGVLERGQHVSDLEVDGHQDSCSGVAQHDGAPVAVENGAVGRREGVERGDEHAGAGPGLLRRDRREGRLEHQLGAGDHRVDQFHLFAGAHDPEPEAGITEGGLTVVGGSVGLEVGLGGADAPFHDRGQQVGRGHDIGVASRPRRRRVVVDRVGGPDGHRVAADGHRVERAEAAAREHGSDPRAVSRRSRSPGACPAQA